MGIVVKRSFRFSVTVKIDKKCNIVINAPYLFSDEQVLAFIKKHEQWIAKRYGECVSRPIIFYQKFFPIEGYKVKVHKVKADKIVYVKQGGHIYIPKAFYSSKSIFYKKTTEFYKKVITPVIERYVKRYCKLLGVKYNNLVIRSSETRWGSCSSKGNLNFSYRLGFVPLKLLRYVVAHEVAHLKEMNHSKRFWNTVQQIYPKYKEARKELRLWERVRLIE